MAKVKICGLKDPDMVGIAARAGADWIGLMFAPSPRQVTRAAAETLLLSVHEAVPVAVMVDPSDEDVRAVAAIGIRVLQLHGSETPERVAAIKAMTGCEIWKAFGVRDAGDLLRAAVYASADRLLLDAKPPDGVQQAGGNGAVFDWDLLAGWSAPKPWLLSGGLTPENVAGAIARTGAQAVDVSSGVELIRGLKDKARVEAFIRAAKEG